MNSAAYYSVEDKAEFLVCGSVTIPMKAIVQYLRAVFLSYCTRWPDSV